VGPVEAVGGPLRDPGDSEKWVELRFTTADSNAVVTTTPGGGPLG
jgi:hypothetical protein